MTGSEALSSNSLPINAPLRNATIMAALPHRPKGPPNNRTQGNGLDIAGTAKKNKNKKSKVVHDWELYIIDDSLEQNWERFLHDLGLGDFKSKKQCQKVTSKQPASSPAIRCWRI